MTWSKYGNKKTYGHDSKKEARRAQELWLLQRAGQISTLRQQVTFELIPAQYINGKCVERACRYVADFVYTQDGKTVVEDVKGYKTPDYIIKRKLMLHVHGIRILET